MPSATQPRPLLNQRSLRLVLSYSNGAAEQLRGTTNEWVLKAPAEILKRDFTLEVLTLFIPGWVETDQLERIASLICQLENIPFTILAFFPAFLMTDVPRPTLPQMLEAYNAVQEVGLRNVKLGNYSVFARTDEDWDKLLATVGPAGIG